MTFNYCRTVFISLNTSALFDFSIANKHRLSFVLNTFQLKRRLDNTPTTLYVGQIRSSSLAIEPAVTGVSAVQVYASAANTLSLTGTTFALGASNATVTMSTSLEAVGASTNTVLYSRVTFSNGTVLDVPMRTVTVGNLISIGTPGDQIPVVGGSGVTVGVTLQSAVSASTTWTISLAGYTLSSNTVTFASTDAVGTVKQVTLLVTAVSPSTDTTKPAIVSAKITSGPLLNTVLDHLGAQDVYEAYSDLVSVTGVGFAGSMQFLSGETKNLTVAPNAVAAGETVTLRVVTRVRKQRRKLKSHAAK